jgi:hypothetical protein
MSMLEADASSSGGAGLISTILYAIVAATIPAVLAAIGFWWRERRNSHDIATEHHRVLAELKEEIDAIAAWITAYNLVSPSAADSATSLRARKNLESAYERLERTLQKKPVVREHIGLGDYARIALLRRDLPNRSSRVARRFYYASLVWALILNLLCVSLLFASHQNLSLVSWILDIVIFWVIFVPPAPIFFFMLTNRRERRAQTEDAHVIPVPQR